MLLMLSVSLTDFGN